MTILESAGDDILINILFLYTYLNKDQNHNRRLLEEYKTHVLCLLHNGNYLMERMYAYKYLLLKETYIASSHEELYILNIQNISLRTPKYVLMTSYIRIPTKYTHILTMG